MPRFGLHEFSRPDYRGSLPERDPNNAIWPRISMFAKMLHDMSWEEEPEEPKEPEEPTEVTQEELDDAKAQAESDMLGYEPKSEIEAKKMEGYHPYNETVDGPELTRSPRDMGKQQELAEKGSDELDAFLAGFDPKKSSKEDVRKMQRIVAPVDAELSDPDDAPSNKYFDDGIWGKASKKAFKDYMQSRGF